MFGNLCYLMRNHKGFTLVELMVVMVIIGVLAAIAVPVYNSTQKTAKQRAVEANLRIIDGAIIQCQASENKINVTKDDIDTEYLQAWPNGPDGAEYDVVSNRAVVKVNEDWSGNLSAGVNLEDITWP